MKRLREILLEGTPQTSHEVVHHISPNDIDEFHPLSHLGTYRASRDVGSYQHQYSDGHEDFENKPKYRDRFHYKARLINKGNIHHFDFDSGTHTPDSLISHLHDAGVFSQQEKDNHHAELKLIHKDTGGSDYKPDIKAKQYAADAIRSKGIHLLSYKNEFEDTGKMSYITTHSNQVHVLKKTPITVKSNMHKKADGEPAKRRTQIKWHTK